MFGLASVGMTMIIVYGKIFKSLRQKIDNLKVETITDLIHCPMCMGFWSGVLLSWLIPLPLPYLWASPFISGCISSVLSWITASLIDDDGLVIKFKRD